MFNLFTRTNSQFISLATCLTLALGSVCSFAAEPQLEGRKQVYAVTRDGKQLTLGHVEFTPIDKTSTRFKLTMDSPLFVDYFLSMREFKCLDNALEVTCHVPYPYQNPNVITDKNMAWLEHSLLFLFKQPRDFGAKLWNGSYYQFERVGQRLIGRAQAVDLNHISAPSSTPELAPYTPDLRTDAAAGARWIDHLLIE